MSVMQESALIFRCDATPTIGIGHVKRCLALAAWAQTRGIPCYIAARFLTDAIKHELQESHIGYLPLSPPTQAQSEDCSRASEVSYEQWLGVPWEVDADDTLAAIATAGLSGVLVVDHYGIDHRWERRLRRGSNAIFVIDDLANRQHDCDVLLDQTLGREPTDYARWIPSPCTLLLGTSYALLRPEFAAHRGLAESRRRTATGVRRIFVSLGGTDAHNLTEVVLNALTTQLGQPNIAVDVVLSRAAPHFDRIVAAAVSAPLQIAVHADSFDVAKLMVDADLAIGAAGTMSWERACLGLPTVMVVTADNQRQIADALAHTDAVDFIGDWRSVDAETIAASVRRFSDDSSRWRRAVDAAFAICDGRGAERVLNQIAIANR